MPRSKANPEQFETGALPKITVSNQTYFVDGRMKELRNVNDFMDKPQVNDNFWARLTKDQKSIVKFEFYGN